MSALSKQESINQQAKVRLVRSRIYTLGAVAVEAESAREFSSFTTRELRYFTTVADTLNFHRAAAALFVSQPSLSKQIKALESRVGVRLLERSTRSVRLTPEGRLFAQLAATLLDNLDSAVEMARHTNRLPGAIRLLHCAEGSGQAARFTIALRDEGVAVEVHSHEVIASDLEWSGASGVNTIGIASRSNPALVALPWASDPVVAILPAAHALSGRPTLTMNELARFPFGALGEFDAPGLRDRLGEVCSPSVPQVIDSGTEELFLSSHVVVLDVLSRCKVLSTRFEVVRLTDVKAVEMCLVVTEGSVAESVARKVAAAHGAPGCGEAAA